MWCVENLYVEVNMYVEVNVYVEINVYVKVNMYVTLWSSPLTEVTKSRKKRHHSAC